MLYVSTVTVIPKLHHQGWEGLLATRWLDWQWGLVLLLDQWSAGDSCLHWWGVMMCMCKVHVVKVMSSVYPYTAGSRGYPQLYCHWVPIVLIHCHGLGPVSLSDRTWSGEDITCKRNNNYDWQSYSSHVYTFLSVVNCGWIFLPMEESWQQKGPRTKALLPIYSCNPGYTLSRGHTRICQAIVETGVGLVFVSTWSNHR